MGVSLQTGHYSL
jgi:hypothetical protein